MMRFLRRALTLAVSLAVGGHALSGVGTPELMEHGVLNIMHDSLAGARRSHARSQHAELISAAGYREQMPVTDEISLLQADPVKVVKRSNDISGAAEQSSQPDGDPDTLAFPRPGAFSVLEMNESVAALRSWQPADITPSISAGQPEDAGVVGDLDTLTSPRPPASSIWDVNRSWATIREWHPAGVISNTNPQGKVVWADEVAHMSLNGLLLLSVIGYPAALVIILVFMAVVVSMCLSEHQGAHLERAPEIQNWGTASAADSSGDVPIMSVDQLSPFSRTAYGVWAFACRTIPSQMVFGVPIGLCCISRYYPQEVFSILTLVTATAIFFNGTYTLIFSGNAVMRMRRHLATDYKALLHGPRQRVAEQPSQSDIDEVMHWVILPQYTEDLEIISMTLDSLCMCPSSRHTISVVFAMEEREADAPQKAQTLTDKFSGSLCEILTTHHPANLPNDPPGKASNTAWAFKHLVAHLERHGRDFSKIIVTVADADSDFHEGYYQGLAQLYLETEPENRDRRIWQSPVFHLKNYHRQPGPLIVGSVFCSMAEMASLADPNSVRFPYSTYSLSLKLAQHVGGWDPEWIAEDWHMGIKCFLLTLGQTSVVPILLPTLNYTPEDTTWWGTISARWTQAKRHALGFSDSAYYFMMLPLIFAHCVQSGDGRSMRDFWSMLFSGCTIIIRLINVHVIVGVLTTYGILTLSLKTIMVLFFHDSRHITLLFDRTYFCAYMLYGASSFSMLILLVLFQSVYDLVKHRIETPEGGVGVVHRWKFLHFLYTLLCFVFFATVYFVALAATFWKAAWDVLTTKTHVYEVAAKRRDV